MYCSNCGKELPDGSEFCERCGSFSKTTENGENKSAVLNNLSPKVKKIIIGIVAVIIAIIVIASFSGSSSKVEGTWLNDDEGTLSLESDGTFFINGRSKGTWEKSGDEVTLYYYSGNSDTFVVEIDGDTMTMTPDSGSPMICRRID